MFPILRLARTRAHPSGGVHPYSPEMPLPFRWISRRPTIPSPSPLSCLSSLIPIHPSVANCRPSLPAAPDRSSAPCHRCSSGEQLRQPHQAAWREAVQGSRRISSVHFVVCSWYESKANNKDLWRGVHEVPVLRQSKSISVQFWVPDWFLFDFCSVVMQLGFGEGRPKNMSLHHVRGAVWRSIPSIEDGGHNAWMWLCWWWWWSCRPGCWHEGRTGWNEA
jgi:hypothetical protein